MPDLPGPHYIGKEFAATCPTCDRWHVFTVTTMCHGSYFAVSEVGVCAAGPPGTRASMNIGTGAAAPRRPKG